MTPILRQLYEKIGSFIPFRSKRSRYQQKPNVITRDQHPISRKSISHNAVKVLYRLHNAGFQAYLVGGGVRDLLLGREPKDFDVATDARPEQIRKLFKNCRLIGRRFRLAHIFFGPEIIEVATFRATERKNSRNQRNGMILRDNVYGEIGSDALRRDFTINAMYYNIADFTLEDYAGGMQDIEAGVIRLIGDPVTRYQEDPVRMLRAIRFAIKLGFKLAPETEAPLHKMAHLLSAISSSRLFDETLKLLLSGQGMATYSKLYHYNLFQQLFPATSTCIETCSDDSVHAFIQLALQASDERIAQGKSITLGFFFAVMLWHPLKLKANSLIEQGVYPEPAFDKAAKIVLNAQAKHTALPKSVTAVVHDIWYLQRRFERTAERRTIKLIDHPRFRAGYDFLILRAKSGEPVERLSNWWQEFYEAHYDHRWQMIKEAQLNAAPKPSSGARKKRRRRTS